MLSLEVSPRALKGQAGPGRLPAYSVEPTLGPVLGPACQVSSPASPLSSSLPMCGPFGS